MSLYEAAKAVIERYGFVSSAQLKKMHLMAEAEGRLVDAVAAYESKSAGRSSFACWWAMMNAEAALTMNPIKDEEIILAFTGSAASHQVTAKDIRDMLAQ